MNQKVLQKTIDILQQENSEAAAKKFLRSVQISDQEAQATFAEAVRLIKAEIRKAGILKALGGFGAIALFGIITIASGRIYFYLAFIAIAGAVGLLYGLAQAVFAFGYGAETD